MSDTEKETLDPATNPLPSQGELQPDHADDEIGGIESPPPQKPPMETSMEDEEDSGKLQSEDADDEIGGVKVKEHPSLSKSEHTPADRADPLCDSGLKVRKKASTPPMAQQETSRDDEEDSSPNKGELKPADIANDVDRSKAQEHKTQLQVAQHVTSREEELSVSKTLGDEQITAVAEDSEENPQVALIIKILLMVAILWIILFVFYFGYSLFKLGSNDATLEDKILSGSKIESLRMLKESTIQNYSTIYITLILILLIVMFSGFGLVIFYKDVLKHHSSSKWHVVRTAIRAVGVKEVVLRRLQGDLNSETSQKEKLQEDIREYSEELRKKDAENLELEKQNKKKDEELSEAQARLEDKDRRLGEAKKREQKLNEDLEASNQELKVNNMSKLEDDLNQPKTTLRNRLSTQQTMQKKDKGSCNIQ